MSSAAFAALLSAICFVESSYSHKALTVVDGNSASYGKCQVKLSTARFVGYKGTVTELWLNPKTNTSIAGRYLGYQLKRYRGDIRKAVSAYNCGTACNNPGYVNRVLSVWGKK